MISYMHNGRLVRVAEPDEAENIFKTCPRCHERKALKHFATDSSRPYGKHPWCRLCATAATRAWQAANRERCRSVAAARATAQRKR